MVHESATQRDPWCDVCKGQGAGGRESARARVQGVFQLCRA